MARTYRQSSDGAVLVAGWHTAASVERAVPRDKTILYIPPAGMDSVVRRQVLARLLAISEGVMMLDGPDSVSGATNAQPMPLVDNYVQEAAVDGRWPWAVEVRPSALREFLAAAGIDFAQLSADTTPVVRPLALQVWPDLVKDTTPALVTLPNVTGMLEGTDSLLKQEYIVIAAPLDGARGSTRQGDSMPNRAASDTIDDASGLATLLALAEAFSQPGVHPRRSLLFLATSGEQRGRWGTNFFVVEKQRQIRDITAALTIDRLGGDPGSEVTIDGSQDVELIPPLAWIASTHPELGLVITDGGTVARPESNPFPFVRHAVPSLAFSQKTAANSAANSRRVTGPPATIDAAQVARVGQLVFYVGQGIANADRWPHWTAAGRQQWTRVKASLVPR